MKRPASVWIWTGATLLAFQLLGWLMPGLLGLDAAADRWILRGGLWLLGLIATALVFVWRSRKAKAAPPTEPEKADEIDVTLAAARTRLAAAKGKAAGKFGRLPIILVAGPTGAAKTTIITRSGLEPELLAGEVHRGDMVVPTAAVNAWFAQGSLVLEAGGATVADGGRWRRLIRHLQPNRLAAIFSRGRQAPRVAVVCFGIDELLKPGASESVPAAAQRLRARLAEVAQQIGIRLPVYVIFTKSDRLPYFEDYLRNFTRDESRDVLGATLTVLPAGNVGQYAERESRRITEAFHALFRGLALRRLDVLPRENQDTLRSGAYEFPREFRKIAELATQFLLDLCRPSQLGVSPFLRGFYFTGVRAVYVHDVAPPVPQASPAASSGMMDATGVFDPRMLQQQAQPAQPAPGARKVPEWAFLERVFRDVIQKDAVARAVTAGGTKVTLGRRIALGTAIAALAIFSLGMTWSFFANRAVQRDVRAAAEGARGLVRVAGLPDLDALQRLDRLRAEAERLDRWSRDGHPMRMSWALFAGDRIQPDVRAFYFDRFAELLWNQTRQTLTNWLGSLPDSVTAESDYDASYDALKAYLVTTAYADSARRDFLAPVLTRYWSMGTPVDSARRALAQAQFAFFADELPFGNPFDHTADEQLVQRTRGFLQKFAGEDQLYSYLLAIARDSVSSVRWTDPAVVRNEFEVPAEFTRPGWDRAQAALADLERLLSREPWVAGESVVPPEERMRIGQALRERYTTDYTNTWIRFLQAGTVAGFSGVNDAANRLQRLITNPWPLIRMIGLASTNTAVNDTLRVGRAFRPAHTVASPDGTTLTEAGGQYINALTALQSAVANVSSSTGSMREQAQVLASTSAQQVRGVVGGLAVTFDASGEAQVVGAAVRRLLEAPVLGAEAALGRVSIDEVNRAGQDFCGPLRALGSKFPFDPQSTTEATIAEITNLFAPGTGAIWTFYDSNLQNLLQRSGTQFIARPGASPEPNPRFRDYFNYLAQVSNALFPPNATSPQVLFDLRMQTSFAVPEVTVTIGGRPSRYTQTQPSAPPFEWTGAASGARIVARVENDEITYADFPPGAWSVFRLFYAAQVESRGAAQVATWRVPGQPVAITGELRLDGSAPIFQSGYLRRVGQCVSQIAR